MTCHTVSESRVKSQDCQVKVCVKQVRVQCRCTEAGESSESSESGRDRAVVRGTCPSFPLPASFGGPPGPSGPPPQPQGPGPPQPPYHPQGGPIGNTVEYSRLQ